MRRLQVELVCQDGTQGHDPFWDAPRLMPSFVAQVLGQAMARRMVQGEAPRFADTRYAARPEACARLLDRKS